MALREMYRSSHSYDIGLKNFKTQLQVGNQVSLLTPAVAAFTSENTLFINHAMLRVDIPTMADNRVSSMTLEDLNITHRAVRMRELG